MSNIVFEVSGTPRPQGSKRHVGGGKMLESSKHVKDWREAIEIEAWQAMQLTGWKKTNQPIEVYILFSFPRPAYHWRKKKPGTEVLASAPRFHTNKPDVDKLTRAVFDALSGVLYEDDSQVVYSVSSKVYSSSPSGSAIINVMHAEKERRR